MGIVIKAEVVGNSEERHAVIVDCNDERWEYTLQFNPRTWRDEEDYLDNAHTDFENEWKVAEKLGLTIHSTDLFVFEK